MTIEEKNFRMLVDVLAHQYALIRINGRILAKLNDVPSDKLAQFEAHITKENVETIRKYTNDILSKLKDR